METNLTDEILRVCQILNKNDVQYLIVGGTAVAFHGYFRWSQNSTGAPSVAHKMSNPSIGQCRLLTALEREIWAE